MNELQPDRWKQVFDDLPMPEGITVQEFQVLREQHWQAIESDLKIQFINRLAGYLKRGKLPREILNDIETLMELEMKDCE